MGRIRPNEITVFNIHRGEGVRDEPKECLRRRLSFVTFPQFWTNKYSNFIHL